VGIPDNDPEKEVAGKKPVFKIEIKEVKEKKLPALDDELAKDVGLTSFSELKEKVTAALTSERTRQQTREQKNLLVNKLIELHPIEAPEPMIEREMESIQKQSELKELTPEQEKSLREIAANRVKGSLIISAIADCEKIEVTDQEMEVAIKQATEGAGLPFEEGKKEILNNPNALRGLRVITRETKTVEALYALAQFEKIQ
jgi:trigger factor